MARQSFGESSRPRRRLRRIVQTFDLAGARQRLPLARSVLAEVAERHAAVVKSERLLRHAVGAAKSIARGELELEQAARTAATREARRLGLRILAGAAGGAFPTLVNGALAYLVLLQEDDDIYNWRYRDEPKLRPIPAAWYAAAPQRTLCGDGLPLA